MLFSLHLWTIFLLYPGKHKCYFKEEWSTENSLLKPMGVR